MRQVCAENEAKVGGDLGEAGTRADGLARHQSSAFACPLSNEAKQVTIRRQHDLVVLLSLAPESSLVWTSDSQ